MDFNVFSKLVRGGVNLDPSFEYGHDTDMSYRSLFINSIIRYLKTMKKNLPSSV